MTSKKQYRMVVRDKRLANDQAEQNNSSVDNDSQVERLSKTIPGPKAKLPAEGEKEKPALGPQLGKGQKLWKQQPIFPEILPENKDDELPF